MIAHDTERERENCHDSVADNRISSGLEERERERGEEHPINKT